MVKPKKRSGSISKILIILGIVIVVIFAGYFFVNREIVRPVQQGVTTAESKSRDATRKAALINYSFLLETYKSQTGSYPISASCANPDSLGMSPAAYPGTGTARDTSNPKQNSSWPDYCYQSDATGTKFTLWTKLENSYDTKTSQANTIPYFPVPSGFEPCYYFIQSEE